MINYKPVRNLDMPKGSRPGVGSAQNATRESRCENETERYMRVDLVVKILEYIN